MKSVLVLMVFGVTAAFAQQESFDNSLENRVSQLESRLEAITSGLADKLINCEMRYRKYGTYLNNCPRGTFVQKVFKVGNNVHQVECGHYQLQCRK